MIVPDLCSQNDKRDQYYKKYHFRDSDGAVVTYTYGINSKKTSPTKKPESQRVSVISLFTYQ